MTSELQKAKEDKTKLQREIVKMIIEYENKYPGVMITQMRYSAARYFKDDKSKEEYMHVHLTTEID